MLALLSRAKNNPKLMKTKKSRQRSMFVVAGETSGDLLASRVVRTLKRRDPKLKVFGLGGPALAAAGMDVREDLTKQSLIGFVEVAKHLPQIFRRFSQCERWFREERPDLVFLTDYPGFNLRLAERAHALGIPVCYYVAPQAWAWHESRVAVMRKVISRLLVLFPFEEPWFRERGVEALYVGHPMAETIRPTAPQPFTQALRICVMPGSRPSELERLWPLMLTASRLLRKTHPSACFVVPLPPSVPASVFPGLTDSDPFSFVRSDDMKARGACHFAWVKSGTSTVETALLGTPHLIVYKVASLSYRIAKALVKVKYAGILNLILGRLAVPELLQDDATPDRMVAETLAVLGSPERLRGQRRAFSELRKILSRPAHASANAARAVQEMLR